MLEVVKKMRKEDFNMCTAVNIFEEKMKEIGDKLDLKVEK